MVIARWNGTDDLDEADLRLLSPRVAPAVDPRVEQIAAHVRGIMDVLGLDRSDPNLIETDERVARMYLEIFSGLDVGAEPKITTFPNDEGYSQIVAVFDVPFYSMCAHHFLPFFGRAHVAYVPAGEVIGISKLARIVELYARRPQIQERMTEQIVDFLEDRLNPIGAIAVVEGRHMCMEMRGVKSHGSTTVTSAVRGSFRDRVQREEFSELLRRQRG